jgi:enamine deaminase RidA (YjgF/YER057c/UK114 family)
VTGRPAERLQALGLTLPDVVPPLAAYVPAVRSGSLVFSAGQLPFAEGVLLATGKVGADVSTEVAADCARQAAFNAVAAIAAEAGDVDAIERIVKVTVYVAGPPEFTEQPAVANGASDLLGTIFGDAGRHARSAVGVASLPLDAPVEVEVVAAMGSK